MALFATDIFYPRGPNIGQVALITAGGPLLGQLENFQKPTSCAKTNFLATFALNFLRSRISADCMDEESKLLLKSFKHN